MKKMKHVLGLATAVSLALTMGMTVLAADENTGSITIQNAGTNITSTHAYEAYQVFSGDLSNGNKLSNIEWGNGVDGAALLEDLNKQTAYSNCTTAASVAEVLSGFDNDSNELEAFNAIVAKHTVPDNKKESSNSSFSGLEYGYWFVEDVTKMSADGTDAKSAYILQVIGQATLKIKADAPSITKKIVEGESRVDTNNVAIGDTVTYEIKTAVPDMTHFNNYYFFVEDTLSKGLTYTENSLNVTIDGNEYTSYVPKVEKKDSTNETTITVDFDNLFTDFNDSTNADVKAGNEIVISYSAVLNENAIVGSTGNPNTVKLTYTNDATWNGSGEPSEGPTGVTPEDKVITYVTEIELLKTDTSATPKKLEGAVFRIEGETLNTVLVEGEVFTADANGSYWKLKNGSYTTTAPTDASKDSYESTDQKYKMETTRTIKTTPGESVVYEGVSDANGKVKFTGIKAGTYTITEVAAPAGYNKLANPVTVEVGWTKPENADNPGISADNEPCTWKFATDGAVNIKETVADGGKIAFTIQNASGSVLPSTGGIGTTIIYIIGGILVIGGAAAIIIKRKKDSE